MNFFKIMKTKDFEDAFACLAVYSVDNKDGIYELENKYLSSLRKYNKSCKIVFACNKYDIKDKYEQDATDLENQFENVNKRSDYSYKPALYVSGKTGYNVAKVLDQLMEGALEDYINHKQNTNNDAEWKKITERCNELRDNAQGKNVSFCVEDNDYDAVYDNQESIFQEEKYNKKTLYKCYYEGNEWFTDNFKVKCQEFWQKNVYKDRKQAVQHMFNKLRERTPKWQPLIFAVDIDRKIVIRGKWKEQWIGKNDKIVIYAFC